MLPSSRRKKRLAIGVLLALSLLATLAVGGYSYQLHAQGEAAAFDLAVQQAKAKIESRFAAYAQVLRASAALFVVNDAVDREQWRAFVQHLDAQQQLPGIQGIGFAKYLTRSELGAHEAALKAEGFDDYRVYPPWIGRSEGSAVQFIEPFDERNQRSFGYDMFSHPVRRKAMELARDTGEPALSGPVILLQEFGLGDQVGTLLYFPLYKDGDAPATLAERQATLSGWVFSPFRMKDLMQGILGQDVSGLQLRLYDGRSKAPETMLYQNIARPPGLAGDLAQDVSLELAGRTWLLSVAAPHELFDPRTALVLGVGLLVSVLLAVIVSSLSRSEERALELAFDMNQALRDEEARQRAIVDGTADGVLTVNERGEIESLNRAAERIFGYDEGEMLGENISSLMPERFRVTHQALLADVDKLLSVSQDGLRREMIGLRKTGEEFPLSLSINAMPTQGERLFVCLATDVSERKQAEALQARADHQREVILKNAPFAIISTDAAGVIQTVNPAAEHLLQYHASELVGQQNPSLLHDPDELFELAAELSRKLQKSVDSGFEVLVAQAKLGQTEEREWTYVRRDNSRVPVHVVVNALNGPDGSIEGYLFIAHDISARKNAQAHVEHLAHYDALTNLPNRLLLKDRLQQAIEQAKRKREMVAVLLVDLDHFKRINDSLGHHIGDELLMSVANRLKYCVRGVDTVARMGGDEFIVVLSGIKKEADIRKVVRPMLTALSEPIRVHGHEMTVTPSIGISQFPKDALDGAVLLKQADTAMYQAKDAGRGNFQFFSSEMQTHSTSRLEMENGLRKAIANDELSVAYQPQVDFESGRVVGCEALVRWRNAMLGEVSPGSFIPLAEETGLIQPIGEWVLRKACEEVSALHERLGFRFSVAVNISPRQFFSSDLLALIRSALDDSGLPAEYLEIEITEGVLVKKPEETTRLLRKIRQLGVKVAIDDFGTGYSSLAYLTSFPIDKLKIDQSFVRDVTEDPNDAAVTSAIIVMAHALHMSVVAEGVENLKQFDFLSQRHCDVAQGYFFARPMASALFAEAVTTIHNGLQKPGAEPQASLSAS